MASGNHIIIIGGGVIGCSIAYHLAKTGTRVTVLERGKIGGAASGVAAGMVASLSEGLNGPALKAAQESRALLLELLPQLQEESGIDVEYIPSGILHIAFTEEEEKDLRRRLVWQVPLNMGVRWLSDKEIHNMEPAIAEGARGALFSPQEGHLNSRRLVRALAQGAAMRGATLLQDTEVTGLLSKGGKILGVQTPLGELQCDCVVLSSGAWTAQYGGWLGINIPVYPIKGQILAGRILPIPISRIVWRGMTYLLPKADGSIVMGTTSEEAEFHDRATLLGIATILKSAIELVPAVAKGELYKTWAGLRPGSPDGVPILGPVPGWDGIALAVGHYRSGILLSAITGKLISDYIIRGEVESLEPFSLARFAS